MACHDRRSWEKFYTHQITESSRRLERLLSIAPAVGRDLRLDFERALDDLRGRLNRALAKLEAMRRSHDDAWRQAKVHADSAFAALFDAFETFESPFRPSIVAV